MNFIPILCLALPMFGCAAAELSAELVDARRIWDQAPHNAFTDLIRFREQWFCVFREGGAHVSPDGALRVIYSQDTVNWSSAALVTSTNSDLRDAKISITPDGRLMLAGAGAMHDKSRKTHESLAWFSKDGRQWSGASVIGDPNMWLWRIVWNGPTAYSVGYDTAGEGFIRLYRSTNGTEFETWVHKLNSEERPNEAALVFLPEKTALCLLRRDGKPGNGLLGTSQPPYKQWDWQDLGFKIGGPQMIRLAGGELVAAVRLYDRKTRTSLVQVDPAHPTRSREILALPSGGDCSYAGMVEHDGLLRVSYYSSHEGKTSIYLASVKLQARN